jgi:hypothetical protein
MCAPCHQAPGSRAGINGNLKRVAYTAFAGICFALANAVTWTVTFKMGFKHQSDAFWQYAIASAFSAPLIWRGSPCRSLAC